MYYALYQKTQQICVNATTEDRDLIIETSILTNKYIIYGDKLYFLSFWLLLNIKMKLILVCFDVFAKLLQCQVFQISKYIP